ncbi:MAG: hypothetical protein OEZ58_01620 [Gammaproteobacteria bacterium]|nr:hypothetical protein [Gammaproteobacteria bacterium]MDH5727659.1 hypothetical protein [Gammaproteobacteria bacterium]
MNKFYGMSWVEAFMVLAVLGLISMFAIPKLIGLNNEVQMRAMVQAHEAVKTGFAYAIADQQRFPEIQELANYVDADEVHAADEGVNLTVDGYQFVVRTYIGETCLVDELTASESDVVRCIGAIYNQ